MDVEEDTCKRVTNRNNGWALGYEDPMRTENRDTHCTIIMTENWLNDCYDRFFRVGGLVCIS